MVSLLSYIFMLSSSFNAFKISGTIVHKNTFSGELISTEDNKLDVNEPHPVPSETYAQTPQVESLSLIAQKVK